MEYPSMILFDYGQTLCDEERFDGVRGTRALLQHAIENKYGKTAEEVQERADQLMRELLPCRTAAPFAELHQYPFQKYLYASMGIRFSLSPYEMENLFWDAAAPGRPAPGIEKLLEELHARHIRTGVISNISFSGRALRERIGRLLPGHHFEFILASSDYLFRKPSPHFFSLALEMAGLSASQAWFIGDNPACDVAGARQMGMSALWYTGCLQGKCEPPAGDVTAISDWAQLPALLDALR